MLKKDDIPWHNFVVSYMDAVDSAYSFQIMAYNMIQSGKASEEEIKNAKSLAQQQMARSNQLYSLAKGVLFPRVLYRSDH